MPLVKIPMVSAPQNHVKCKEMCTFSFNFRKRRGYLPVKNHENTWFLHVLADPIAVGWGYFTPKFNGYTYRE